MKDTHYHPILRSALLALSLMGFVSSPLYAEQEVLFPHVFNLGSGNNTYIYVQNLSDSDTNNIRVRFVGQDGMDANIQDKTLQPLASSRFEMPNTGFQGVAKVMCAQDCTVTGTWNFSLEGQGDFAVGISPMDPMESSTDWASAIPLLSEGSGFGVAAYNAGTSPTTCSVFYYTLGGEQLMFSDGFPPNQGIPVGGQTAFLSSNMPDNVPPGDVGPDGFEGSLLLKCFDPVIPIVINQDQVNGFPTPINMEMRQMPSGE